MPYLAWVSYAAALNFVAFNHFVAGGVAGQVFTVFIIVLAASEAAIALAIVTCRRAMQPLLMALFPAFLPRRRNNTER